MLSSVFSLQPVNGIANRNNVNLQLFTSWKQSHNPLLHVCVPTPSWCVTTVVVVTADIGCCTTTAGAGVYAVCWYCGADICRPRQMQKSMMKERCSNQIKNNNWDASKILGLQKKRPHLATVKGPLDEKGFRVYLPSVLYSRVSHWISNLQRSAVLDRRSFFI